MYIGPWQEYYAFAQKVPPRRKEKSLASIREKIQESVYSNLAPEEARRLLEIVDPIINREEENHHAGDGDDNDDMVKRGGEGGTQHLSHVSSSHVSPHLNIFNKGYGRKLMKRISAYSPPRGWSAGDNNTNNNNRSRHGSRSKSKSNNTKASEQQRSMSLYSTTRIMGEKGATSLISERGGERRRKRRRQLSEATLPPLSSSFSSSSSSSSSAGHGERRVGGGRMTMIPHTSLSEPCSSGRSSTGRSDDDDECNVGLTNMSLSLARSQPRHQRSTSSYDSTRAMQLLQLAKAASTGKPSSSIRNSEGVGIESRKMAETFQQYWSWANPSSSSLATTKGPAIKKRMMMKKRKENNTIPKPAGHLPKLKDVNKMRHAYLQSSSGYETGNQLFAKNANPHPSARSLSQGGSPPSSSSSVSGSKDDLARVARYFEGWDPYDMSMLMCSQDDGYEEERKREKQYPQGHDEEKRDDLCRQPASFTITSSFHAPAPPLLPTISSSSFSPSSKEKKKEKEDAVHREEEERCMSVDDLMTWVDALPLDGH